MTDWPHEDLTLDEPADEESPAGGQCPFCRPQLLAGAIARHGTVFAVADTHPVSEGHVLIVTVRHTADFFSMSADEHRHADELLQELRDLALHRDPEITGFNVGSNCGQSAGQKIMHAHIHLIPRRGGQGKNGRGVKGVIRNKLAY